MKKLYCLHCHKTLLRGQKKFCSRSHLASYWNSRLVGERARRWKGGERINSKGYIEVYVGNGRYRAKHRIIMEKHLGRKLKPNEIVHHKDDNKLNNKIINLKLLGGQAKHVRIHNRRRRVS